jgi:hypothetical protein
MWVDWEGYFEDAVHHNKRTIKPARFAFWSQLSATYTSFRIYPGLQKGLWIFDMQAQSGAPVLLMHQEFLNGDSWFKPVGSQNQSRLLPLMLFDEGFDVWIGHQRATYWGHDHAQLGHTETVLY